MSDMLGKYLLNGDRAAFAANFSNHEKEAEVTLQMYDLFVNGNSAKDIPTNIAQRDKNQKTLLHYAVGGGVSPSRCPYAKILCKQDSSGLSALMIAAAHHNQEWVQYLVEHEAGLVDVNGRSALFYACQNATTPESYRIIDFLLNYEWFIVDSEGRIFLDYLGKKSAFYEFCDGRVRENIAKHERMPEGMFVCTEIVKIHGNNAELQRVCSIWQLIRETEEEIAEWTNKVEFSERERQDELRIAQESTEEMSSAIESRQKRANQLRELLEGAEMVEELNRKLSAELSTLEGGGVPLSPSNANRRRELEEKLHRSFESVNM